MIRLGDNSETIVDLIKSDSYEDLILFCKKKNIKLSEYHNEKK